MQMIADITGKPITVNCNSQAGSLGCCVVAAARGRYYNSFQEAAEHMVIPKKIIKPDMDKHQKYLPYFKKYLELYKNLREFMHQ